MENMKSKKIIKAVIPVLIALFSIFIVARYAASAEFHAKTIAALDDKKTTVMELAAASTAASTAITLIPGDTATPIAEKLADLTSYFLLVLCVLYLEKYLVTITGYLTFVILIPAACVLWSANVFFENDAWRRLAKKISFFGIAMFLLIPSSAKVSGMIETTYQASIEKTIENAKDTTEEIKKEGKKEEEGILSGIISNVKEGVSNVTEKVENILNNFIEALAVMLVTSCVIPVVVLLFFVWLIKNILGADISLKKKTMN